MSEILVVGAVHLDIVAELDDSTSVVIDKPARITYAVGGTAFNVAANIAFHGKAVVLYSYVKQGGCSTEIILRELTRRGLKTACIKQSASLPESGFVAFLRNGSVISAACSAGIESVALDYDDLRRIMLHAPLIALDCNLSAVQIRLIATMAIELKKPLCISAVSVGKVPRIAEAVVGMKIPVFRLVTLNQHEVAGIEEVHRDPVSLCATLSAENVVITYAEEGFDLVQAVGARTKIRPATCTVRSTFGAGDALFAAFCDHFATDDELTPDSAARITSAYLIPVLSTLGAAP